MNEHLEGNKSNPATSPAEKKFYSLAEKAHNLQGRLYENNDLVGTFELLHANHLISETAYRNVALYSKRKKEKRNITINGEKFDTPIEDEARSYITLLRNWNDFIIERSMQSPSEAYFADTLKTVNLIFSKEIKPQRKSLEASIDYSLKIQEYFCADSAKKIRMKILLEMEKKYPGFSHGYKPKGSKWLKVRPTRLIGYLEERLLDLFMMESYNSKLLKGFMDDMPPLDGGKLNLEAVFKSDSIQDIYKRLSKGEFANYLSHFGKDADKKTDLDKPEKDVGDLLGIKDFGNALDAAMDLPTGSKEIALFLDDAKENLRNNDFLIDDETGSISIPVGYDSHGETEYIEVDTGEEYEDAIAEISVLIDQVGVDDIVEMLKKNNKEDL